MPTTYISSSRQASAFIAETSDDYVPPDELPGFQLHQFPFLLLGSPHASDHIDLHPRGGGVLMRFRQSHLCLQAQIWVVTA